MNHCIGFRALLSVLLGLLFGAIGSGELWACPYCDSDVGTKVAAEVFNDQFGYHALLTLLPIPVLVAMVAAIHYGVPWPLGRRRAKPSSTEDPH